MTRIRAISGATAIAATLALVPLSNAALAHEAGEQAGEFQQHMARYADNINAIMASVQDIVADYEPGDDYADDIDALIEQWESVAFHEAVEENATPLYSPIWAALGAFSNALKSDAPLDTVQAKARALSAALWQGYGALKLLAKTDIRKSCDHDDAYDHDGDHDADRDYADHDRDDHDSDAHDDTADQAGADNVIDTISDNLDRVLTLYKQGRNEAALDLIHNTYMNYFEGIEGDLIEQDAQLVSSLEVAFNATLPMLIKHDAPAAKVDNRIDAMQDKLDRADDLLEAAEAQETSVF